MRIGMLGTGAVGRTLGGRLVEVGHEVMLGSRTADNDAALDWADGVGERASHGTFSDAASFGELVVNATAGAASLEALAAAGAENLSGKVLLDVSNPLDFSAGELRLTVVNDDSLAEGIQRAFPEARVVKSLNTVNASVMVDPVADTTLFVCGDVDEAKGTVTELLVAIGWPRGAVLDVGDLSAARGMEMYLPLWLRMRSALGTARFNVAVRLDD